MEKYIINYHTGITEEIEVNDLAEAKEIAKNGIAYTQESISILDKNGKVVTESHWFGVNPSDDDYILEEIGGGFYQLWTDELENL